MVKGGRLVFEGRRGDATASNLAARWLRPIINWSRDNRDAPTASMGAFGSKAPKFRDEVSNRLDRLMVILSARDVGAD
jgi:hypothetical protein